jgi:zinc transporter ZupT
MEVLDDERAVLAGCALERVGQHLNGRRGDMSWPRGELARIGSARPRTLLLAGIALVTEAGSTVVGATVLADAGGSFVGTAQAAAAGAVLAVVTVAIVPQVFAEVNRLVAAASAIGFVVGYLLA